MTFLMPSTTVFALLTAKERSLSHFRIEHGFRRVSELCMNVDECDVRRVPVT
jgi:hypothetical protein